jgi:AcrR family transcriptional regulator
MPSTTRQPPARGYHHGDLKNALRAAGSALIAERGVEGVSLREISQAAGVSHTAAYRHYAGKQALLADLAEDGFRQLVRLNRESVRTRPGDPVAQLMACGRAYVRFGVLHPHVLQLMFSQAIPDWSVHPSLQQASEELAATLADVVAAGQAAGVMRPAPAGVVTLTAWSLVHGLALLLAGRRIPAQSIDDAFIERMAEQCVALLMQGLAHRVAGQGQ